MIDITPYSFLWVNVTTSICIVIYMLFTGNKKLTGKIPMWVTVVFTIIVSFRLAFPAEFLKISHTFASYEFLPSVDNVIHKKAVMIPDSFNISVSVALLIIWCVISGVLLLKYFISYYKLYKIVKLTPQLNNKCLEILNNIRRERNLKFKTKIIQSSAVEFPAEWGFFSQTIFINDYNYSKDELRYILLHEIAHFKYGTNRLNLFLNILHMVFWWNPVIYLYKKYVNDIIEMYVDSKVTEGMDESDKCDYIKCIFKVSEIIADTKTSNLKYVTPLIESDSDKLLLKRFNVIKYKNKINILMFVSVFLLFLTYLFISCKYVVQPGWEPPADELKNMETSDFTAENSYMTMEDGQWVLYYNGSLYLSGIDTNNFPDVPIKK